MANGKISIYAFPSLVREEIYKQLDCFCLFDLLQLSKKVKRTFKCDCRRINQKIAIVFGEDITISFLSQPKNEEIGNMQILSEAELSGFEVGYFQKIGDDSEVFAIRDDKPTPTLKMLWGNPWTGLQRVCKELIDIFHTPTFDIKIDLDEHKENYEPIISWINGISKFVKDVQFTGFEFESTILTWCLENLKSTSSITVSTFLGRYVMPDVINVKTGILTICDGKWVQLTHLESMDCAELRLKKTSLGDAILNQFLHVLKRGSNQNLKSLTLEYEGNVTIDAILFGLNAVKRDEGEWAFVLDTGDKCSFTCITEANAYPYGSPDTRIEISIERK
ncbi:hypothetical protein CAEBREN_08147 [Caenorhabditis brenneri]|uniref:Sdz-33 F-box domain-containing protein n=1 Tax=Caenorhabditis brenneri TaxID=135651 RepID=G0NHZ3_CAEBE|nr:hypothetical protein CAEBREN_08147 [Caenorhabditis brenneri]